MRTTLVLDDDLYRRAKATAAHQGRTVTSVIEEALRRSLDAPSNETPLRELPVSQAQGGALPGIDLHDSRSLAAIMDEGLPSNALR